MPKSIPTPHSELVQQAQIVFWMNGYKAVTPEMLADKLNISTSSIYNKYGKDLLFVEALQSYLTSFTDPTLKAMRESEEGLEAFRSVFYQLIDALLDGDFPKSCLMVNTVMELRNEVNEVNQLYNKYFDNIIRSYTITLKRACDLGELKKRHKIPEYTHFLLGTIFGLSVLYKIKTREELRAYIDEQLLMIK